jgi:hypothetical protein
MCSKDVYNYSGAENGVFSMRKYFTQPLSQRNKRKLTALFKTFPLSLHGILGGLNEWDDMEKLSCKRELLKQPGEPPHVPLETL